MGPILDRSGFFFGLEAAFTWANITYFICSNSSGVTSYGSRIWAKEVLFAHVNAAWWGSGVSLWTEFPVSPSNYVGFTPLSNWKLVEFKMLDFSDRTRTGISISASAVDYPGKVIRFIFSPGDFRLPRAFLMLHRRCNKCRQVKLVTFSSQNAINVFCLYFYLFSYGVPNAPFISYRLLIGIFSNMVFKL